MNSTESYEQLLQGMKEEMKQHNDRNAELERQLNSVKEQSVLKDRKIIHLSQRISELAADNDKLNKEIKQKDVILKSQNQSLHKKNVELQTTELKAKQFWKQQLKKQGEQINQLQRIIRQQQSELRDYLKDEEEMVNAFQQAYSGQKYLREEQGLLKEFNEELMKQIETVENSNEKLIVLKSDYEEEVMLQNQQGSDLMVQVEVMLERLQECQ